MTDWGAWGAKPLRGQRRHHRRALIAVVLAWAALVLAPGVVGEPRVGAQEATPSAAAAVTPGVPSPELCRVAPRSLASFRALVDDAASQGTPAAAANPATVPPPPGEPARRLIQNRVIATVEEAIACLMARDYLRYYALLTDEAIRRDVAQFGRPPEPFLALLATPATPEPNSARFVILRAVEDVRMLAGRRVGALVIQDDLADPRPQELLYLVFVAQGDRWLIDEIHYLPDPPLSGTPVP